LKLRHSSLLPQLPPAPQVRLGIIPFSLPGKKHGARSGDLKVRDLWQQKDLPAAEGKVAATVPSHGVVMLRLAR
jgi:hypothetical protein